MLLKNPLKRLKRRIISNNPSLFPICDFAKVKPTEEIKVIERALLGQLPPTFFRAKSVLQGYTANIIPFEIIGNQIATK